MKSQTIPHAVLAVGALLMALAMVGLTTVPALAGHNGAVVTNTDPVACEPITFSAEIADPDGGHIVNNMRLVVSADGDAQNAVIPVDGTSAEITVGPFNQDTTVSYRVFGGGERANDLPLWNGFGEAGFSADITAYANEVGTFNWVVAGTEDPNPFTTWNEVEVPGCAPAAKEECKAGGWEAFGFKNQGQCVRMIETGKDSR